MNLAHDSCQKRITPSGQRPRLIGVLLLWIIPILCINAVLKNSALHAQALPLENGFAAKVNGEVITLGEVLQMIERRIEPSLGRFPESVLEIERLKLKPIILKEMIERKLLVQQAIREGLILPEDAVENYLQRTVERLSRVEGTRFSIDDYLFLWKQQFGESETELRARVNEDLLISELKDKKLKISQSISPKAIRNYYKLHVDEFAQEGRVKFRQLLIPLDDTDYSKIIAEIDTALSEGKDFSSIISSFSSGPRSSAGGLYTLSDSQRDDRFPPVPDIVIGLEEHDISDCFPCLGYSHKILLVERISGGALDFSDAQGQIRRILLNQIQEENRIKFQRTLWKDAQIEIYLHGVELPKF